MTTEAIKVSSLRRSYGRGANRITALDDVSFEVASGEVVALLGSNGAGKTTLIKVLATLLLPSSGTVAVAGHDVVRKPRLAREATSVVFGGDQGLYARLSANDNLRFFGMLGGVAHRELRSRIDAALRQVNLTDVAHRRVETYSKGMRQRLHLAIGLLARPKVLLLDEPTVGLDPIEAERIRAVIRRVREDGAAVLLTSHYLLDVERLADRVVLLSDGRLLSDLKVAEFVRKSECLATVTIRGSGTPPCADALDTPPGLEISEVRGTAPSWEVDMRVREWNATVFSQLGTIFADARVEDVQVRETRLEEAFVTMLSRDSP